jgi:hypothetical protein
VTKTLDIPFSYLRKYSEATHDDKIFGGCILRVGFNMADAVDDGTGRYYLASCSKEGAKFYNLRSGSPLLSGDVETEITGSKWSTTVKQVAAHFAKQNMWCCIEIIKE